MTSQSATITSSATISILWHLREQHGMLVCQNHTCLRIKNLSYHNRSMDVSRFPQSKHWFRLHVKILQILPLASVCDHAELPLCLYHPKDSIFRGLPCSHRRCMYHMIRYTTVSDHLSASSFAAFFSVSRSFLL